MNKWFLRGRKWFTLGLFYTQWLSSGPLHLPFICSHLLCVLVYCRVQQSFRGSREVKSVPFSRMTHFLFIAFTNQCSCRTLETDSVLTFSLRAPALAWVKINTHHYTLTRLHSRACCTVCCKKRSRTQKKARSVPNISSGNKVTNEKAQMRRSTLPYLKIELKSRELWCSHTTTSHVHSFHDHGPWGNSTGYTSLKWTCIGIN